MERKPVNSLQQYASLLGGLAFMSFAAVLIKASKAPGIVTTFYRMAIGVTVLFIPFIVHVFKSGTRLPRKGLFMAILAGLAFGCDLALWSTGVVASNATIPTLFANLAPVWVGFGAILFFREKQKGGFWIGLIIAISGIVLLISNDLDANGRILYGALFGLAAGLFYASFYMLTQISRKLLDTICYLFISTLSSACILLILVLIFGYNFTGYEKQTWYLFIALGIGVQVIGWFLISYSQGYLPATIVSPTLLGQPVITAFLATYLLTERLTWIHISGGIVVVAGIYFVHYSRFKKR